MRKGMGYTVVSATLLNPHFPLSFLVVLGVIFIYFFFQSHFLIKFLQANRIAPDGTPCSASGTMLFAYVPQKGRRAKMS